MTGPGIHKKEGAAPEAYQALADKVHAWTFEALHEIRLAEIEENGDSGPIVQGALAALLEFAVAPMPMSAPSENLRESLLEIYTNILDQTLMQREMIAYGARRDGVTRSLPDGIYIGLSFEEYLAQVDRLGGHDKAVLWLRGRGWWWASSHNPYRGQRKSTPEQIFGTALHAMLLEGRHIYERRFCVKPDKADYPDALMNTDQIKAALRGEKVNLGSTTGWKAEDWADAAEIHLPGVDVWANLESEFERRHGGRMPISAEDDFAIRAMHTLATDERPENAEMREILSVGAHFPILAEISVLYTDETGLQHRARFDKLLPVASIDLKSVGEWQGRPLAAILDLHIKKMGYDVGAADYHVARQHMNRMLLEGEHNLHGGTAEEREHLMATALWNQTNAWGWCWIFQQKPTTTGNAPILFPLRDPWKGPYHLGGFRKRQQGLALYRRCVAEFGFHKPWGHVEPVHWADEGAEHHIWLSDRDWGPEDPVEGEAEHFGYKG